MHKKITINRSPLVSSNYRTFCFLSLSALASSQINATELTISHSQFEQSVDVQNTQLMLTPSGEGIAFAFDLNENWRVSLDYQGWQEKSQLINNTNVESKLSSWGTSISYYQEQWFVSSTLSRSSDDLSIRGLRRAENYKEESTNIDSIALTTGYNWQQNNWLYDVSITAQYNQWDISTEQRTSRIENNELQLGEIITEKTRNTSSQINLAAALSHYWSLSNDRSILAGIMVSWDHTFTGDEVFANEQQSTRPPTRPTSRPNQQNNSPLSSPLSSGDDSYGQLAFYLSYDLNKDWSLDLSLSQAIASIENSQGWSVSTSYYF